MFLKKYTPLSIAALLLVTLTACSPPPTEAEPEAKSDTPAAAETEEVKENRSERGNLIKAVGERAWMSDEQTDEELYGFTITKITVDPECTSEYAQSPEFGHFIRIDIEGETSASLEEELVWSTNSISRWIKPDGMTANAEPLDGNGRMCLTDDEMLPDRAGPGEKLSGSLVLDVPTPEGTLIYGPLALAYGSGSWEWVITDSTSA